tara:strand:+ start:184 stop:579 length:396 start_codon:yes stop_codon:yes gene_type:complete
MKIIKFKEKKNYNYKRKIFIKDLILKISVGIHSFEKKKKQRVRFNLTISSNPHVVPNKKDLSSIINYESVINEIKKITKKKHYDLLEDLAESIFDQIFKNNLVHKIVLKIEKLDIFKNTNSVGIEISKTKS